MRWCARSLLGSKAKAVTASCLASCASRTLVLLSLSRARRPMLVQAAMCGRARDPSSAMACIKSAHARMFTSCRAKQSRLSGTLLLAASASLTHAVNVELACATTAVTTELAPSFHAPRLTIHARTFCSYVCRTCAQTVQLLGVNMHAQYLESTPSAFSQVLQQLACTNEDRSQCPPVGHAPRLLC